MIPDPAVLLIVLGCGALVAEVAFIRNNKVAPEYKTPTKSILKMACGVSVLVLLLILFVSASITR